MTTEKLKTLKDMVGKGYYNKNGNPKIYVDLDTLKENAIKLYKEMQGVMYDNGLHYSTIFIKKFFNLTKEDLK